MLPVLFGENLFDELFDDAFRPMWDMDRALYGKHARAVMKTDVRETDSGYELDIDLPGFKKDEVKLDLKDGYLTISAAKGLDRDEKDKQGRYIRQERYAGQCSRSFYVGDSIQPADVHAKFEDGILKLTLPKAAQEKLPHPNPIPIESWPPGGPAPQPQTPPPKERSGGAGLFVSARRRKALRPACATGPRHAKAPRRLSARGGCKLR